MGVRAIGVDIVDVGRFAATLGANARLAGRLFTPAERGLPARSLAARFAAKEAVAKALGAPGGLRHGKARAWRSYQARSRGAMAEGSGIGVM